MRSQQSEKLFQATQISFLTNGVLNSYDIYILKKLQFANICSKDLKAALKATAEKRGTLEVLVEYEKIMKTVKDSAVMQKEWKNYQKAFNYAVGIDFDECCDTVKDVMEAAIN